MNVLSSDRRKALGFIAVLLLLIAAAVASILFGLQNFHFSAVLHAYTAFTGSDEQLIIQLSRVPRALTAAVIGCNLAISGVLLQAMTKNPLASPSLLGINAGAALAIVAMLYWFGAVFSFSQLMWFGFIGAAITAGLILMIAMLGHGGMTPIKLILTGSAVALFASSLTSLFMLISNETLEGALYWLAGSLSNSNMDHTMQLLPYFITAWAVALFMCRSLNIMALGEEIATGLGQHMLWIRTTVIFVVVLLAGGSVALAGPISFVGIMIPHISRWLIGNDHRLLLPFSGLLGAAFLLLADLSSRFLLEAKEVPVGVTTAVLGVPFVVVLIRRKALGQS
ncbi:iron ABC transporter permease [Paenibacillus dendritiformis]|uniref:FecCD family ABC transporter permease n=1 Tax=Paenibacillus dendritiformis TaxID=130049 RepID=UPI00248B9251|nr:iron ABC transporter permease [Paenibacillus dendritiformis]WGU92886.1 iron ABC transporter permease [Paenibacillus dendritiformis]